MAIKITKEVSDRINILRSILLLFIILIHSQNDQPDQLTKFIQLFLVTIARSAIPMYFIISGFLFFKNFESFSWNLYLKKIKSRISSLLIPYFFYNSFFLIIILLAQVIPATASFIDGSYKKLILDYQITDFLNAFGIINRPPIAYHFWYIKDLIFCAIISPILFVLISKNITILIMLLYLILSHNLVFFHLSFIYGIVFFCLGGWLTRKPIDILFGRKILLKNQQKNILFIIWIAGISVSSTNVFSIFQNLIIKNILITIGVISIWHFSGFIVGKKIHLLNYLNVYGFFIYAVHEPTLMIFLQLTNVFLALPVPIVNLFNFLLVPVIVIALNLWIGITIQRFAPDIFQVITGGRAIKKSTVDTR